MLNQMIVDILVRKIRNSEINSKTCQPMVLEDIKVQGYKDAVIEIIIQAASNQAT